MELIAPGILCVLAASTALVAVLETDATRACLSLGVTVVCVAALALLQFDAPLAAAAVLITQGGLGVVSARLGRHTAVVGGRTRQGWVPAVIVIFCGILLAALAPATTLLLEPATSWPDSPPGPVPGPVPGSGTFLVAAVGLAALAVTLGLQAIAQMYPEAQDA